MPALYSAYGRRFNNLTTAMPLRTNRPRAQVAELVDALASGASGLTAVKVRVLSWAPLARKWLKFLTCWAIDGKAGVPCRCKWSVSLPYLAGLADQMIHSIERRVALNERTNRQRPRSPDDNQFSSKFRGSVALMCNAHVAHGAPHSPATRRPAGPGDGNFAGRSFRRDRYSRKPVTTNSGISAPASMNSSLPGHPKMPPE
jgi:hypothetical protein